MWIYFTLSTILAGLHVATNSEKHFEKLSSGRFLLFFYYYFVSISGTLQEVVMMPCPTINLLNPLGIHYSLNGLK